jgi:phage terminase small subunit
MPAHTKGAVQTGKPRLKAPAGLADGPAAVFVYIVRSVDPDHFSEVDLPLLEAYANAAHLSAVASDNIARDGAVIDGKQSVWVGIQERATKQLVALSARLRVAPQSRFDRLVAGANSRRQPHLRKPWESDPLLAGYEQDEDRAEEFFRKTR